MTPISLTQHGWLAKYKTEEVWYPQTVLIGESGLLECDHDTLDVQLPTF